MSEDFAAIPTLMRPPSVEQVLELDSIVNPETGKPWLTKSGAELKVLAALPYLWMQRFTTYDPNELRSMPEKFDIRGFRVYEVDRIPKGKIGGTEFHRIRQEIIFCTEGTVDWECEDIYGKTRTFRLGKDKSIYMPPFIKHSYRTPEDGPESSGLSIICNTLFDPKDKRTHDSFSQEVFEELQKYFR